MQRLIDVPHESDETQPNSRLDITCDNIYAKIKFHLVRFCSVQIARSSNICLHGHSNSIPVIGIIVLLLVLPDVLYRLFISISLSTSEVNDGKEFVQIQSCPTNVNSNKFKFQQISLHS